MLPGRGWRVPVVGRRKPRSTDDSADSGFTSRRLGAGQWDDQPVHFELLAAESTTPLWVPIAIAAVGVVGTLLSPIVTMLLAQRAERIRRAEDRTDRSGVWQREDSQRWLEHRREAHRSFLAASYELRLALFARGRSGTPRADLPQLLTDAHKARLDVALWGGEAASEAAGSVWQAFVAGGSTEPSNLSLLDASATKEAFAEIWSAADLRYRERVDSYRIAARADLGVHAEHEDPGRLGT